MRSLTILLVTLLLTNVLFINAATPLDFDGDHKSDFAVSRVRTSGIPTPLVYIDWLIAKSSDNQMMSAQWGAGYNGGSLDTQVPEDYDGDGKTDLAVWRPSNTPGELAFYIFRSSDSTPEVVGFGLDGDDLRAVGDYDGDGKADLAVYRPSEIFNEQTYFIYRGTFNNPDNHLTYVPWGRGNEGSRMIKGDFDGDGKLDFCLRNSNGEDVVKLYLLRSSDLNVEFTRWGLASDNIYPGDYDGDGKTDLAFLRQVNNSYQWYILERDGGGTGAAPILWGRQDLLDTPVTGLDYDGDGKSDIAVHRKMTGGSHDIFYVRRSSDGMMFVYPWGVSGAGTYAITNF